MPKPKPTSLIVHLKALLIWVC